MAWEAWNAMVFEHIEKLQQQYTDKYVAVEDSRPELKRFKGQTGVVRTVNMSGRALVEFDANNNTGWIDIDIDYLKVVDKPAPKEVKKKPAPKILPWKRLVVAKRRRVACRSKR